MVPPRLFDRRLRRMRLDRAAALVDSVAPVLEEVADRLVDRLDDTTRRFERALDMGGRHGLVAARLRARGIGLVVGTDLSQRMAARARAAGMAACVVDEEALPFADASFDLVVSNLALHATNDLVGALIQARRALRPDGLFLATLFGAGTLAGVREALLAAEVTVRGGAGPRVFPFVDVRDAAGLLQRAGFALPVADQETITLEYADWGRALADVRAMGETNILADGAGFLGSEGLAALMAALGPPVVEISIVTLTGWAG